MRQPADLPFLERAVYRARRVQDAGRLLPVLGAVLFLLPILWAAGQTGSTVRSGIYLFTAWAALVACSAVLSRILIRTDGIESEKAQPDRKADD
ncbi:hypothetical protein PARPLA_02609 [Rhodobacteraceae bacterium THAF1]|uniref:hypothetical protein n=1 Tax=Palleronia sp. THAF1 TaxID=2587842 RepID=UPI000F406D25|nr:hypothetical protein [Palleronia sp. THAF1]QFU08088.1 hypothetical protein FIU81_05320 [Palleronia sp. THAF1]VDC27946.1 hypothetical protein PARPLA_02609 [Rhodobacteraceae bacterium THAF1]